MRQDLLASLRHLSDAELVARVQELAARERGATVLLVAHLAELDTREVHFRAGHGSLFAYCRDVLALSEQEAYNRIAVARATRRFPVILELIEDGAVNLTTVRLLSPHLTPANHRVVLESARGKTKAQVEEIAAALWPRPDAPSFVRKLPSSLASTAPVSSLGSAHRALPGSPGGETAPSSRASGAVDPAWPPDVSTYDAAAYAPPPALLPPTRRSAEVTPLAPDRYRVQVTIGGNTLEKLRLAKDLLRHAVPSGDEAAILDRALTALLADLAQKKFAAAERPRASGGAVPGSRHVPAEVKRTVWLRDLGRCAFVGTSGRRCNERGFLEFHHVTPYALGGEATVANIQLRCRSHNAYEARLYFGYGNGNGGAGAVREDAAAYTSYADAACGIQHQERSSIPPPDSRSSRQGRSRTRSGTSLRSGALRGPAP
jgi:hypothetical protein